MTSIKNQRKWYRREVLPFYVCSSISHSNSFKSRYQLQTAANHCVRIIQKLTITWHIHIHIHIVLLWLLIRYNVQQSYQLPLENWNTTELKEKEHFHSSLGAYCSLYIYQSSIMQNMHSGECLRIPSPSKGDAAEPHFILFHFKCVFMNL